MTAPLDRVKALLAALPKEEQEELHRYLDDILVTPEEAEGIQVASLTDTRSGKVTTYTFRQEHVRCGKPNCWCREGAIAHGPYTYKYWKEGGKLRKEYVPLSKGVSRPSGRRRAIRARDSIAASSSGPALPG